MQTILGANGQIGQELAKELFRNYNQRIRVVSRRPQKINATDEVLAADLMDPQACSAAIAGSEIVYFTVGLPMDSQLWRRSFPVMIENVISSCHKQGARLVFFDNSYMYAKSSDPQTEESPFLPIGAKSRIRAAMANRVLEAIQTKEIDGVICRAPEFYGPGQTQSITNTMLFDNIKAGRQLKVPLRDDRLRTLIWTPDASRATALIGNTADAFNQTWHLPCDNDHPTYKSLISMAADIYQKELPYYILKKWAFRLGSLFKKEIRELSELLPRYEVDTIFLSDKFSKRFPDFKVTSYADGIKTIREEQASILQN